VIEKKWKQKSWQGTIPWSSSMKIYKYKDLFALLTTVGWISFIYSAFMGFHYWYLGFVFFFWFCLSILNYRHETTFWLLKNRRSRFIKYYLALVVLGFVADYVIGQQLVNLWSYRIYSSISDWFRLYFLIYPLGGLSVVELIYFLASILKEKVVLIHDDVKNLFVNKLTHVTDTILVLIILTCLILKNFNLFNNIQIIFMIVFPIWIILTTLKLKYYIKHFTHWIAIVVTTAILSIFMHEIPNVAVYEWKYYPPEFFSFQIWGISIWVVVGWYFLVLVMLKYWIQIVLLKDRK